MKRSILLALLAASIQGKTIVDLAVSTPDLSTLVAALTAGDLVSTLSSPGPFTVFAPTNEAFTALPAGVLASLLNPANKAQLVDVLTYHVASGSVHAKDITDGQKIKTVEGNYVTARVAGSSIFINSAKVTTADLDASNGVVHIIDAVLIPSGKPPAPSPTPPAPTPAPATKTIVQLAVATPDLSTLVTALKAGDLVDTLSGAGPFTVFAPTNEAFAALPAGTLSNLLKPANKAQLVDLLTYHVVSGSVHAKDITNYEQIRTIEGNVVTAISNTTGVFINNAQVTTADVDATNGVVHIINAVLIFKGFPNHLFFRGIDSISPGSDARCGDVDAAPRMPAAIFEPKNALFLKAYEELTVDFYNTSTGLFPSTLGKLSVGRCKDIGYTQAAGGETGVNWAPAKLMGPICVKQCGCSFENWCFYNPTATGCKGKTGLPGCPQAGNDDPQAGKFCSLCGSMDNSPITINLWTKPSN